METSEERKIKREKRLKSTRTKDASDNGQREKSLLNKGRGNRGENKMPGRNYLCSRERKRSGTGRRKSRKREAKY